MNTSSASAIRASQNEVANLSKRLNALGDVAGIEQLNADLKRLQTNLTNASTPLDIRVARSGFADTSAQMRRQAQAAETEARASAKASASANAHASSLEALRAKYNPLYSASKAYEHALQEIAEAERLGAINSKHASDARTRAASQLANASGAADQYASSMMRSNAMTQQGVMIGHQVSDVLIQAQMGFASVGQIALMQGSQIASQMQALRASGGSAFKALLSGIASLISPLTLGVLAVTALGTAVAKWMFSSAEETKSFSDALGDADSAINSLRSATDALSGASLGKLADGYGRVNDELLVHLKRLREVARAEAANVNRDMIASVQDELTSDGNLFTGDVDAIRRAFDTTSGSARHLLNLMESIRTASTFEEQSEHISTMRAEVERLSGGLGAAEGEAEKALIQLIKSEDAAKRLVAAQEGTVETTKRSTRAASSLATQLGTAADAANKLLDTLGAIPAVVGAMGRSIDQQIESMMAENRSLTLQLETGISGQAANRRVQLETLLGSGAITPDAAVAESARIDELEALAKQQEALRKRLSDSDKSGGGEDTLLKSIRDRAESLQIEIEANKILDAGRAQSAETARLMAEASLSGALATDQATQAIFNQIHALEKLAGVAKTPAQEWLSSVPTWKEAGAAIDAQVFDSLSDTISTFAKTGKLDVDAMFAGMLNSALEMVSQMATQEIFGSLGGGGSGGGGFLGTIFGGGGSFGDVLAGFFKEGGHTNAPVSTAPVPLSSFRNAPSFSQGTPNVSGIPAVLHDNEAVVPLSRGRKIPVELGEGMARDHGNGLVFSPTFNVTTPDADSFRKSKDQLLNETFESSRRAAAKNG